MPSSRSQPRDPHDDPHGSAARRQRRRRTHQRVDSDGGLLPPKTPRRRDYDDDRVYVETTYYDDGQGSPSKSRPKRRPDVRDGERRRRRESESRYTESRSSASAALSAGQLARLDQLNRHLGWEDEDHGPGRRRAREREEELARRDGRQEEWEREERERRREEHRERKWRKREQEERDKAAVLAAMAAARGDEEDSGCVRDSPLKSRYAGTVRDAGRVVSGQRLERGRLRGGAGGAGGAGSSDGGYSDEETYRGDEYRKREGTSTDLEFEESEKKRKRKRNILIIVGIVLLILVIAIPVGVVLSKKKNNNGSGSSSAATTSTPANSNLDGMSESDIPKPYQGTSFDPFTWYDTQDFNVTFTSELVGGLPLMGLNSTWDDTARANPNVKPLNESWTYGTDLIRGVNLGGWLSIEPVITPSLFSSYNTHDNVVDEYTLSQTLGTNKAKTTIEKHYSSFVSEQTFANISAAGFDHVRIPFSYWAVVTYDGDPYVANISFRYLLRGIEWARKYGLRVNLDLHGAPGSQNGWNHSGRQGTIGWLNGTDGDLNANRTIEIHHQLSTFFTQPRYKNIITMYGLVNEPRMVELDQDAVIAWSETAIATIRGNGFDGIVIFGDGFMGLDNWQGKFSNINKTNLLLDVHQYVIFNTQQLVLDHYDKINFACAGWTAQALRSENTATGFGPTLCGEWSQADTDCAQYLNNVGVGSRWEGTLNYASGLGGSTASSVLTPTCPLQSHACSCDGANADPSAYSAEYKKWLLMFAEAQMHSFEQGWGWFYWTWQTESAAQWSYRDGLANGILPELAYKRDFNCESVGIPMFNQSGLPEYY